MRKLITSVTLGLAVMSANAQTNATNWTAIDCGGVSHTLFNELDNGKIIVMVWVMPCGMCISGAQAASNAVNSYATSNPGKVVGFLADDIGDNTCSDLSSWMSVNSVPGNFTVFSNAGKAIDEANYGGSGMPHVVVMAGTDHKIYYNQMGSNIGILPIKNAINNALAATEVASVPGDAVFSPSPNPVTETLTVNYSKPVNKITITAVNGQVVKTENYHNGKTNPTINLSGIPTGVYMLKITDADGKTGIRKIVKE